jgi:hypothetical protein
VACRGNAGGSAGGHHFAKAAKEMMAKIDAGDMKAALASGEVAEQQLEK